ncbi:hypothetical protein GQ43DRAFT_202442 [Delitschia confertaspora ATCC 74209]|uniref:Phosphoribosylaminoimidazole-succinocarboxamide synthase n=1 Tax=Delitschia confertaspora ATCC 74209 TaxID=1513339 RepID=A0A9P4MRZ6_9PLEO|nr:hypothetical protein GQ43DRAFT_202442 [Delitschia confertaspora ATCC 74209]
MPRREHPLRKGEKLVGEEMGREVERLSLKIYEVSATCTEEVDLTLPDSRLEFGLDESVSPPAVVLVDEVLTLDNSRFWNRDMWRKVSVRWEADASY